MLIEPPPIAMSIDNDNGIIIKNILEQINIRIRNKDKELI